jgi:hypothetical protein
MLTAEQMLVVLTKGEDERAEWITVNSDRFSDLLTAIRQQYPGWHLVEWLS